MIVFHDSTYCLGVWFVAGGGVDWLAVVTRDPGEPLTLQYRVRYSDGHENWWKAVLTGREEEGAIAVVDRLYGDTWAVVSAPSRDRLAPERWRLIIRGTKEATVAALLASGHVKVTLVSLGFKN